METSSPGKDICRVQEIRIDGDGSDVVQVGVGDCCTVDLGLEHGSLHGGSRGVEGKAWTGRMVPVRAATIPPTERSGIVVPPRTITSLARISDTVIVGSGPRPFPDLCALYDSLRQAPCVACRIPGSPRAQSAGRMDPTHRECGPFKTLNLPAFTLSGTGWCSGRAFEPARREAGMAHSVAPVVDIRDCDRTRGLRPARTALARP